MNASTVSVASISGTTRQIGSLPRWERMLLALELGTNSGGGDGDGHGDSGRRSARDWLADSVLFAFGVLAAGAVAINGHLQAGGRTMLVINGALAVPVCLSLWARRRHPVAVAWLSVGLSALSNASVHAAQAAIFSAAIHARPRRAAEVALAAVGATAIDCAIYTGVHSHSSFNTSFFTSWTANTVAALALGSFIRVRRELVRRLQAEQQLRAHEARLAERTRIAREMHDALAHRISLLSVHAGALEFNRDASPAEIARGLSVIRSNARAAQEELRDVIGVLRSEPADETVQPPQPTIADLGRLIDESREAGMDITVHDELSDSPLSPLVGRTAYRVVQEALTNARKHAAGQPVSIAITGIAGTTLRIEVANRPAVGKADKDGDKPPEQIGSRTGLTGLAERLAVVGGTLTHRSLPAGGFRLTAEIPWAFAEPDGDGANSRPPS
jgi:signal transduction histidine kinase